MRRFGRAFIVAAAGLEAGLTVAAGLTSCLSGYEIISRDVPPEGWAGPVVMRYANSDTLAVKDLSLVVRYGIEASPRTGDYVVGTTSPTGVQTRDTLRVALPITVADNNLHEVRTQLSSLTLNEAGEWTFTVTPLQETRGVWSIALDFK